MEGVNYRAAAPIYTKPKLDHLEFLTHRYGLLEHTNGRKHRLKEGYAVDDNARAAIVAIQYGDKERAKRYFEFLVKAQEDGKMHCDMNNRGEWVDKPGLGDWFGRAFWAACYTMRYGPTIRLRKQAMDLLRHLIPSCKDVTSLRTAAYILLGLCSLEQIEWDEMGEERKVAVDHLLELILNEYKSHGTADWQWPASVKSYDNARIPESLLEVGRVFHRPDLIELGLDTLNFVIDSNYDILDNHFRFIGNKGWYKKGQLKALFDEQPIEAGAMVQACCAAYHASGLNYYKEMAKKAFAWFHGDNIHRRPMYNPSLGSVYDGITEQGINQNQGAESTLEYLLAYVCYAKITL